MESWSKERNGAREETMQRIGEFMALACLKRQISMEGAIIRLNGVI